MEILENCCDATLNSNLLAQQPALCEFLQGFFVNVRPTGFYESEAKAYHFWLSPCGRGKPGDHYKETEKKLDFFCYKNRLAFSFIKQNYQDSKGHSHDLQSFTVHLQMSKFYIVFFK